MTEGSEHRETAGVGVVRVGGRVMGGKKKDICFVLCKPTWLLTVNCFFVAPASVSLAVPLCLFVPPLLPSISSVFPRICLYVSWPRALFVPSESPAIGLVPSKPPLAMSNTRKSRRPTRCAWGMSGRECACPRPLKTPLWTSTMCTGHVYHPPRPTCRKWWSSFKTVFVLLSGSNPCVIRFCGVVVRLLVSSSFCLSYGCFLLSLSVFLSFFCLVSTKMAERLIWEPLF